MFVLADKFDVSFIGLMETFESTSSLLCFDVRESGAPVLIIVIRGGELGIEMILGGKFVD